MAGLSVSQREREADLTARERYKTYKLHRHVLDHTYKDAEQEDQVPVLAGPAGPGLEAREVVVVEEDLFTHTDDIGPTLSTCCQSVQ